MRVAIAEDWPLYRELLAGMLPSLGIQVTAQAPTGAGLLDKIAADPPDVAIIDIRMAGDDDGLDVAETIRERYPEVGILILSQYSETAYAVRAAGLGDRRVGYLTKDRVDIHSLRDALHRIASGESYFDPAIIRRLVQRQHDINLLGELDQGELDVLRLVAEGRSNRGIGEQLHLSHRTIERTITEIYQKLGFEHFDDRENHNFRVLATLRVLQATGRTGTDTA
jgi:DNA-binding NarL/FixJ family response regulator